MTQTEELFDILDDFGDKTGESASKAAVHERELWHGGAHVWLYNAKGEVLLQLRAPQVAIYPNTWDIAASGRAHTGEAPVETALRELEEEIGLQLGKSQLEFVGVVRTIQYLADAGITHRVFDHVYIVPAELDPASLKLQSEEVSEVRWWPVIELRAVLQDSERRPKLFSPRPYYLFDMPLTEIEQKLSPAQEA